MIDKKCPNCGLWNPPGAMRCDCGYDFDAQSVQASFADANTAAAARHRAERNLPTILLRGAVFIAVYLALALSMFFVLGRKPGGVFLGVAFGLAGAVAALVKIKVKRWF